MSKAELPNKNNLEIGGLTVDNPYEQGHEAYLKGLAAEANPYKGQVEKQEAWEEGWEDAKIGAELKRRSICSDKLEPIE